jgi:hypothetical protein
LIVTNFEILKQEKKVLGVFQTKKNQLRFQKQATKVLTVDFEDVIESRKKEKATSCKQFARQSIFTNFVAKAKPGVKMGIKTKLINNVMCFVHYEITECFCILTVHSKLRPEPLVFVVRDMANFNLDSEITKLQMFQVQKEELSQKQTERAEDEQRIDRELNNFGSIVVLQ